MIIAALKGLERRRSDPFVAAAESPFFQLPAQVGQ